MRNFIKNKLKEKCCEILRKNIRFTRIAKNAESKNAPRSHCEILRFSCEILRFAFTMI
ncbi:hypothetical protein [Helicobacter sp. 23-1045]